MKSHRTRAFTLIGVIGVLAVLAILAAVVLPVLIRDLDRAAADQESANLKAFGAAFQQYVVTTRTIPDQTTWYAAISSQLGTRTNDVIYNAHQQSHQQSRVFLIDGALQMGWGNNVLPYYQTNYVSSTNSPISPVNPRVMIVSSLGKALPAAINTSGVLNATYFSDLWNVADGTLPSDAAWTGWGGDRSDVKVQRINLAPLFVHLLLSHYSSSLTGYYAIDAVDGATPPTPVVAVDAYLIQGTVLSLYTNSAPTGIDTKQILNRDSSFVFEQNIWRGSLSGSVIAGAGNIGDVAQQFLDATPNVNAQLTNGNAQQVAIINSMMNYMSNYNVWAAGNFSDSSLQNELKVIEPNMISTMEGIFLSGAGAGASYYPTNPSPCLQ